MKRPERGICVDGSCMGNPGKWQYQIIDLALGVELYISPILENGTNNIAEYVGIIHAMGLCKKMDLQVFGPIYSDSQTALTWIRNGKSNSSLTHPLLERADKWLKENRSHTSVLKWETKLWGESPADFNRK